MSELTQETNHKPEQKPNDYLVWAITTTVICCLPFGIASIVYSLRVNSDWNAGNYQSAIENSERAKKWAIWSAVAAAAFWIIYFLFILIVGTGVGLFTASESF